MAGIGSKPGERRGGRKKGVPNKANAKREAEIAKSGKTPLQFLIDRMRNAKAAMTERIECAKAAAPYVHPRLQATEIRNPDGETLVIRVVR